MKPSVITFKYCYSVFEDSDKFRQNYNEDFLKNFRNSDLIAAKSSETLPSYLKDKLENWFKQRSINLAQIKSSIFHYKPDLNKIKDATCLLKNLTYQREVYFEMEIISSEYTVIDTIQETDYSDRQNSQKEILLLVEGDQSDVFKKNINFNGEIKRLNTFNEIVTYRPVHF